MNLRLDFFWDIFQPHNFDQISHENRRLFDEGGYSYAAALLAERVYPDFLHDDFRNTGNYRIRTSTFKCDVQASLITNINHPTNKIIVIRGSSSCCNWILNFLPGGFMFLFAVGKISVFILLFANLYNKLNSLGLAILDINSLRNNSVVIMKSLKKTFVDLEMFNVESISSISSLLVSAVAACLVLFFFTAILAKIFPILQKIKHTGYYALYEEIKNEFHFDVNDKVVVIGHSLGGGIAEFFFGENENVRGFLFNKAIGKFYAFDPSYRARSVDHRISFDALTYITVLFFYPLKMPITLKGRTHIKNRNILIVSIVLLLGSIGLRVHSEQYSFYVLLSAIVGMFYFIQRCLNGFFFSDHDMAEVRRALKK